MNFNTQGTITSRSAHLRRRKLYIFAIHFMLYGIFILSGTTVASADDEHEPKKLALIIGNENYTNLEPIPSARADAENMTRVLSELGFEVSNYIDVPTSREFEYEILPKFAKQIEEGDLVLFFFSGHGLSAGAYNFIAPTGIPLEMEESKVFSLAIPIEAIEDYFVGLHPGLLIFFVDACRTPPKFIIRDKNNINIVVKKGYTLPKQYNTAVNTIIAYATRPGEFSVGFAGNDQMSIFTNALVNNIGEKGVSFHNIFDQLSAEVELSTEGEQVPGLYDWSQTDPYFNPDSSVLERIQEVWLSALQSANNTGNSRDIEIFLRRFSVSRYVKAAKRWLVEIAPTMTMSQHIPVSLAKIKDDEIRRNRIFLPTAFGPSIAIPRYPQQSIEIIASSREGGVIELIDKRPVIDTIKKLKDQGWIISQVALSIATIDNQQEQESREARLANAAYVLKKEAGLRAWQIIRASDNQYTGNGVKVTFFAQKTNQ